MSLVLEGFALAIEGAGLIIDCACCIKEKCEAIACLKDNDCDEAGLSEGATCYCRGKACTSNPSCTGDDDCPDGKVCIDGECLPPCRGQSCEGDDNCPEECVCVDGGCFDPSQIYYCWGDANDPDADGDCKQGVPPPPDYTTKGGPYLSLGLCAQSGCKTKYECNPTLGDCYPSLTGPYESLYECQTNCGSGTDQGRCCQNTVWYDANGEVIRNESTCADCCGGDKVPTNPDEPDENILRCINTASCLKRDCISDPPLQNGQAGSRTFRQFNSLFSNCDGCPASGTGPCCHEDKDPGSPTFGEEICTSATRTTCTEVLEGEWKGDTWWTCEDEREETGREFACADCNGLGDCSCGNSEFCFNQRCNGCDNPNAIPTVEGRVIEVRFDGPAAIDGDPKIYRKYYFRVLTCPGQTVIDNKFEPVRISGRIAGENDYTELLIVDNRDPDSNGYTIYEDDECYDSIIAQKVDGTPSKIGLCYFWQDPFIPNPVCAPFLASCFCSFGEELVEATFPVGAVVNCNDPAEPLEAETYNWEEAQRTEYPIKDLDFTVNGCATRLYAQTTGFWMSEDHAYVWSMECDFATYEIKSKRYIASLPDGSYADVTDDWFTPLPSADGVYENSLVRTSHYRCNECNENLDCLDEETCRGSDCANLLGLAPPMSRPSPLLDCFGIRRKSTRLNPLP